MQLLDPCDEKVAVVRVCHVVSPAYRRIDINACHVFSAYRLIGEFAVISAAIDGMGMGLGFTMALVMLGAVREILGSGSLFGFKFIQGDGMIVFVLAPGAFLALGYLIVIINKINKKNA